MLESLNTLPIIPTDEQKAAYINLANESDLKIVANMFESVQEQLVTLPSGLNKGLELPTAGGRKALAKDNYINLSGEEPTNPFKG